MKPFLRLAIYLAAIISLISCIPMINSYYAPYAVGGKAKNIACGAVAPSNTIEFVVNGVAVQVTGKDTTLKIALNISEGNTATFNSNDVDVIRKGKIGKYKIKRFGYNDFHTKELKYISSKNTLIGRGIGGLFGRTQYFDGWVEFDIQRGESYEAYLPAIWINDQKIIFPKIKFKKKTGIGVYPINC